MKSAPLPADAAAQNKLRQTLASLALQKPRSDTDSSTQPVEKKFKLDENSLGFRSGAFWYANGEAVLTLTDASQSHEIRCGTADWRLGQTALPGTPPRIIAGALKPSRPNKVAAMAAFKGANCEMTWRYYETPHHDTVACEFDGDRVKISFLSSITKLRNGKDARPVLMGRLVKA
ncbi:MAG: hypothetical protein AB1705_25610 [Verrucomicrobiota bacterium]